MAGIHKPKTANKSMEEDTSLTLTLNFCVLYFNPPASILAPTTKSIFPITAPAIDDFTTSNKPSLSAKIDIISSVALPNVPFKNPPILGPA